MPSKLPVIKANIEPEYLYKMKYIAKFYDKSLSKLLVGVIKLYVKNFELYNGMIKL